MADTMSEQMNTMVAMSKEIRLQYNDNAALRAELSKAKRQNEAYVRELKQERQSLARTEAEHCKVIEQNHKLTKQVAELEERTQKQRGIPFTKLR